MSPQDSDAHTRSPQIARDSRDEIAIGNLAETPVRPRVKPADAPDPVPRSRSIFSRMKRLTWTFLLLAVILAGAVGFLTYLLSPSPADGSHTAHALLRVVETPVPQSGDADASSSDSREMDSACVSYLTSRKFLEGLLARPEAADLRMLPQGADATTRLSALLSADANPGLGTIRVSASGGPPDEVARLANLVASELVYRLNLDRRRLREERTEKLDSRIRSAEGELDSLRARLRQLSPPGEAEAIHSARKGDWRSGIGAE